MERRRKGRCADDCDMGIIYDLKVRATSLLCLLGLGLGLGSLFIYKICSRFFYQTSSPTLPRKNISSRSSASKSRQSSPDTPSDSGFSACTTSTMGNNASDQSANISPNNTPYTSVLYKAAEGVRFRNLQGKDPRVEGYKFTNEVGKNSIDKNLLLGREDRDPLLTEGVEANSAVQSVITSAYCKPLSIEILPEDARGKHRDFGSSTNNDLNFASGHFGTTPPESCNRKNSGGTESVGAFSMFPNYSPGSLYEKNQRLQGSFFESCEGDLNSDTLGSSVETDGAHSPLNFHEEVFNEISLSSKETDGNENSESDKHLNNGHNDSIVRTFRDIRHSTPQAHSKEELASPLLGRIISDNGARIRQSFITHSESKDNSTDLSSSKDLSLRRWNSDCSDSVSGIATPNSDIFDPGDAGLGTAASIEHLETELSQIQREINDMSLKVNVLSSQEDLAGEEFMFLSQAARGENFRKVIRVLKKHKTHSDRSSRSRSLSEERELTDSPRTDSRNSSSYNQSGEYIWDYRSDLATTGQTSPGTSHFVVSRPGLSRTSKVDSVNASFQAHELGHKSVHSRLHQTSSLDSSTGESSFKSGQASISDMYIDDSLSQLGKDSLQGSSEQSTGSSSANLPSNGSVDSDNLSHKNVGGDFPQTSITERSQSRGASQSKEHEISLDEAKFTETSRQPVTIGPRRRIEDYVGKEWRGKTSKARKIRKGYQSIPTELNLHHLRVVRGDNYCAIRATLYQAIVNNLPILQHLGSLEDVTKQLEVFRDGKHQYLESWSFAGRLSFSKDHTCIYDRVVECVQCMFAQVEVLSSRTRDMDREEKLAAMLNIGQEVDLQLMEAVKVLMMLDAIRLHKDSITGNEVPVFVWLLFARDTSTGPESFMLNHLNGIGSSFGLEQVEMFLLSHSLRLAIKVVRPSQFGEEDFVTCFKEEGNETLPVIHLIAEDDRHYNVLVT